MDLVTLSLIGIALYAFATQNQTVQGVITGVSTVTKAVANAVSFVAAEYGNAKTLEDETGIDPLITLLQAAHESNFGTSKLAAQYHNLFGIKPSQAWLKAGNPLAHFSSVSSEGGASADFKAYSSDLASMRDWADLLNNLYPLAYEAAQNGDIDMFFAGLQNGVTGADGQPLQYDTDPNYTASALTLLPSLKAALPMDA